MNLFPLPSVRSAVALSALFLITAASGAPAPPTVTVHADQLSGRFVAERMTNASVDAVYGQTNNVGAEDFFTWVRANSGLSYVRCYNWLGDGIPKNRPDWFSGCSVVRSGPGGAPAYRWEGLERVLDTLVASGLKPVIVCGGIPDALAAGPIRRNEGGAAVNRPKDYARYQDMIAQMCRRLEKTYGEKEVRTWYFEAWSQPDHEGSWEGGRRAPFKGELTESAVAPFLRLYDAFAAGALSADLKLRIGGPGLAGDREFLRLFLDHCANGGNKATRQRGTRLDFVSWSRYGAPDEIAAWNEDLRTMIEHDYPALRGVQFLLTESGAGPGDGERSNGATEAARLARLADLNSQSTHGMDLLFRAGDLADDHFDGYRPLLTRIGMNAVPLPAFRLFMLLSKMGTERVKAETPAGIGAIATHPAAKERRNATQVLVYRYDPSVPAASTGEPATVRVRLTGLAPNLVRLPMRIYRIDPRTHAPYEAWTAAERPRPGDGTISAKLQKLGNDLLGNAPFAPDAEDPGIAIQGGTATVDVPLPPNSVALVMLGAEPNAEVQLSDRGQLLRRAEDEFSGAAELVRANAPQRAEAALRKIQARYAGTLWQQNALLALVGLYERDLHSPDQAEAARKELLMLPISDFLRLRVLERLRVDTVRRASTTQAADLTRQIDAIEKRLAAQRQWPLHRYVGE